MQFILITYDIMENRKRTKIHKLLTSYGMAIQHSVFECWMFEEELAWLRAKLHKLLHPLDQNDSIRYYSLCQSCLENLRVEGRDGFQTKQSFHIS